MSGCYGNLQHPMSYLVAACVMREYERRLWLIEFGSYSVVCVSGIMVCDELMMFSKVGRFSESEAEMVINSL